MQQKTLFQPEQLLGKLEFDPRRTEPMLWVRRLVILSRYTTDSKAVLRNIPFHPGLNVICTERRQIGESKVVAHSVGKTLLMRLLRYTIGDQWFATKVDTKRILKKRPDAVVIAEWNIAGQLWTVVRPLNDVDNQHSYAISGQGWEQAVGSGTSGDPFSVFLNRIEEAVCGELPRLQNLAGGPPGWKDVLAWIARDSDCGFRKPDHWRDKQLNPPNLRVPAVNKIVMQWLMGLMSEIEAKARDKVADSRQKKNESNRNIELSKHSVQQAYDSLRKRCDFRAPVFEDGANSPSLMDLVEELRAYALRQKNDSSQVREDYVRDTQERLRILRMRDRQQGDQLATAKADAATARTSLSTLNRKYHDETKTVRGPEQCPAKDECALHQQILRELGAGTRSPTSLHRLQEELAEARQKAEEGESRETKLSETLTNTRNELDELQREFDKQQPERQRFADRWLAFYEESESLAEAAGKLRTTCETQETAANAIKECEQQIDDAQANEPTQQPLKDLISCYLHVLKRIFDADADGDVRVDRNGLWPEPSADLTPNGTAMAVMARVISFELACILASACGIGHHPRLIMHDSPREGEMESALFSKLFDVLNWIEKESEGLPFQYIITTTDPPPEYTANHPKVAEVLHGRNSEGRLLRVKY